MTESDKTLLEEIKLKCYITDENDKTIKRIEMIFKDAKVKLIEQLGAKKTDIFSKAGAEHDLLLNYCFYAWNDNLPEFYKNYVNDILFIRHKYEVENAKEDDELQ